LALSFRSEGLPQLPSSAILGFDLIADLFD
jgi:hypothetical protein